MTSMEIQPGPSRCCPDFNPRELDDGVCPQCGHDHAEDPLSSYPLD